MSEELWQRYDDQGRPLLGQGANKDDTYKKGLLHGAAHVWIWRSRDSRAEVLLQKRAANKRTWPNRFDISAAGHIDLGEEPITAGVRETVEEIGLKVSDNDLALISVQRMNMPAGEGLVENEFQWLYLLELSPDTDFTLEQSEVDSIVWKSVADFRKELDDNPDSYVPHSKLYYGTVCSAIEAASAMIKQ